MKPETEQLHRKMVRLPVIGPDSVSGNRFLGCFNEPRHHSLRSLAKNLRTPGPRISHNHGIRPVNSFNSWTNPRNVSQADSKHQS